MIIDEKAAVDFVVFQQGLKEPPLMTPDGQYYYQLVENDKFILLHKDHPLMKMTDDEFVATLDDPFYDLVAEVTYAAATANK